MGRVDVFFTRYDTAQSRKPKTIRQHRRFSTQMAKSNSLQKQGMKFMVLSSRTIFIYPLLKTRSMYPTLALCPALIWHDVFHPVHEITTCKLRLCICVAQNQDKVSLNRICYSGGGSRQDNRRSIGFNFDGDDFTCASSGRRFNPCTTSLG